MKSVALFLILAASLGAAQDLSAQNITNAPHLPTPVEFQSTDIPAQMVTQPFICGADSKIYIRPTVRENLAGPISALSLSGKSLTIHPAEGTGFPSVYMLPFNADSKGNFYAAIQPTNGVQWYLAAYDNEGHFKWRSPFAGHFTPTFLLPIRNDQFIVGGVHAGASPEKPKGGSVVGVFGKDGVMIHSLSLPDDDVVQGTATQEFSRAIQFGIAMPGPDGLNYIFRASANPKVQILDADGNVIRTLTLPAASDDAWPSNFFVLDNSIAVAYLDSKSDGVCLTEGDFTIYDDKTGGILVNYRIPAKGILTCRASNFLVFLSANKGDANFHLTRTELPTTYCEGRPAKLPSSATSH
jgi:hypothetical protein